jgi:hypothetical protein
MNPAVALALAGHNDALPIPSGPVPPSSNTRKDNLAGPQAAGA